MPKSDLYRLFFAKNDLFYDKSDTLPAAFRQNMIC